MGAARRPATETEAAEVEEAEEASYTKVEFVGEPPYGREFIGSHTIHKSSGKPGAPTERLSFAGQGIEVPVDLVWNAENGYTVLVDSELTDLIEGLRRQPFLKVHD